MRNKKFFRLVIFFVWFLIPLSTVKVYAKSCLLPFESGKNKLVLKDENGRDVDLENLPRFLIVYNFNEQFEQDCIKNPKNQKCIGAQKYLKELIRLQDENSNIETHFDKKRPIGPDEYNRTLGVKVVGVMPHKGVLDVKNQKKDFVNNATKDIILSWKNAKVALDSSSGSNQEKSAGTPLHIWISKGFDLSEMKSRNQNASQTNDVGDVVNPIEGHRDSFGMGGIRVFDTRKKGCPSRDFGFEQIFPSSSEAVSNNGQTVGQYLNERRLLPLDPQTEKGKPRNLLNNFGIEN